MTRPRSLPVVLLVALVGCGDPEDAGDLGAPPQFPVPGCEALDHSACDVRAEACQRRLLELAACFRDDEPGASPPVTLMTEEQYAAYLNDIIAQDPPPDPNHYEIALTMLGLVEPGAFSPMTVVAESVERIAGFYRRDLKDIVLIDHGVDFDEESSSDVLVHEFVHALQDRGVGLDAFIDEHATTYDSILATRAVIEGEARFHEMHYWASLLGLNPAEVDWQSRFQATLEYSEEWVLEQPSPYSATSSAFPYQWGARYMNFTWEEGGIMAVLDLYASPPKTSLELMQSVDGIAPSKLTPTVLTAPVPTAPWALATENVLGAWGLFLAIARVRLPEEAHELALTWRGDGLFVYEDTTSMPPRTAVVWRLELADAASAEAVAQAAAEMVPYIEVSSEGARVALAQSNSGLPLDWASSP